MRKQSGRLIRLRRSPRGSATWSDGAMAAAGSRGSASCRVRSNSREPSDFPRGLFRLGLSRTSGSPPLKVLTSGPSVCRSGGQILGAEITDIGIPAFSSCRRARPSHPELSSFSSLCSLRSTPSPGRNSPGSGSGRKETLQWQLLSPPRMGDHPNMGLRLGRCKRLFVPARKRAQQGARRLKNKGPAEAGP